MSSLPTYLSKALASSAKAKAQWDSLTPIARRDFISWIMSAKQEETRKKRAESVPSRLASGKRRICCYTRVPLDLYGALGANKKAKAFWAMTTPEEKRDISDWIDSGKTPEIRGVRIERAIDALAAGKKKI